MFSSLPNLPWRHHAPIGWESKLRDKQEPSSKSFQFSDVERQTSRKEVDATGVNVARYSAHVKIVQIAIVFWFGVISTFLVILSQV